MTDPTAAERARRYRARHRGERDAPVTSRLEELVRDLVTEIRALRAELVGDPIVARNPPELDVIHNVDNRDERDASRAARDVTERHAPEGARAPTRVRARLTAPSGRSEPLQRSRDVTTILDRVANGTVETQAERILEVLARAHAPQSAAAIADELDIRAVDVLAALVALHGAGRVARIAGATAEERDRWAPVAVTSPGETIACRHYREHAQLGHRRDPSTGRFRCYVCEPDVGQLAATM